MLPNKDLAGQIGLPVSFCGCYLLDQALFQIGITYLVINRAHPHHAAFSKHSG